MKVRVGKPKFLKPEGFSFSDIINLPIKRNWPVVRARGWEDGSLDLIISKHYVFWGEEAIRPTCNLRRSSPMIVPGVNVVVGLKIYQVVALYKVFEVLIFLREVSSSSSFVLKGGDEVEISSKDVKVVNLLLHEPLEKIEET